ncbi:hypothetical protein FTX61_17675 [Nitriliruptoraceae bacterium ZYF776]|nr:hypothetical protein [Profundirhabdus halotolerans]
MSAPSRGRRAPLPEPASARVREDRARLASAWERFWFEPRSLAPLVLVRVVLGLVVAIWGVSLLPDATSFLGPDGVLPDIPEVRARVGLLQVFTGDLAALLVVGALIPAGLAIAVGWRTRWATILAFVLLLSVSRRNPWILNSGDALLRHAVLFLAMTPAGAALSVDRWRTHRDRFWTVPVAAPWGLRLIQLQVSTMYLFSVFEKVRGDAWTDGTALADVWRIGDVARYTMPLALHDSLLVANLLTLGTLAIELALAVLIWNRAARPYVVTAGVLLHLGIEITMAVGFFSTVAVTLYLSFTSPDTAERWIAWVRGRLARARWQPARRLARMGPAR